MSGFIQKWKYFHEGKLSKSHAKAFLVYLNSPDGKNEFQRLLKLVWESEITSDTADAVLSFKKERIKGEEEQKKTNKQTPNLRRYLPRIYSWTRYAAAVLIFFLMFQEWGFLPRYSTASKMEELNLDSSWITKSNPKGIKSKILLPDSSRVFLNAGSEIKYRRNFTVNRQVVLNGEAFFEVEKRHEMPFTVQAAYVTTVVLGTSFNVNTNLSESIEVALATGKIQVRNEQTGKNMQLVPGEGSLVPAGSQPMRKIDIDPTKISLWKEGILHFDREPFQSILKKLENWYDVEISVDGKLPNDRCSGTFQKNAYLSDVLNVLSHAVRFDFELDGKNVSIYPSPN